MIELCRCPNLPRPLLRIALESAFDLPMRNSALMSSAIPAHIYGKRWRSVATILSILLLCLLCPPAVQTVAAAAQTDERRRCALFIARDEKAPSSQGAACFRDGVAMPLLRSLADWGIHSMDVARLRS